MVVPIRSITRKSTGDVFEYGSASEAAGPGPCCVELSKHLKGIQKGVVPDHFGWLKPVTNPDAVAVAETVEEKQDVVVPPKQCDDLAVPVPVPSKINVIVEEKVVIKQVAVEQVAVEA